LQLADPEMLRCPIKSIYRSHQSNHFDPEANTPVQNVTIALTHRHSALSVFRCASLLVDCTCPSCVDGKAVPEQ